MNTILIGSFLVLVLAVVCLPVSFFLFSSANSESASATWKRANPIFRYSFELGHLLENWGICSCFKLFQYLSQFHKPSLEDENLNIEDELFDGVKVRVYKPKEIIKNSPGLVYIHGGGWNLGSVDVYDLFVRSIAQNTGTVVVSIEYRLAPEFPYPIPVEDCLAATKYFLQNAKKYSVDRYRIGISGDSAGGNLAMVISNKLSKSTDLPPLKAQILIYPALQMVDLRLPSFLNNGDRRFLLTSYLMAKFWVSYVFGKTIYVEDFLNNKHLDAQTRKEMARYVDRSLLENGKTKDLQIEPSGNATLQKQIKSLVTNVDISPLLLSDEELKFLPKTYVLTAEFDVLRDEGLILAKRLENIGHPVVHKHWKGVEHGFISERGFETREKAVDHFFNFIKSEL